MTRAPNVIHFPAPKSKAAPGRPYSYQVKDGSEPPPPPRSCARKYPFATMRIGQTFDAPLGDRGRILVAARNYKKRGMRFVTRKISDTHIRVYREE